jgi:sugar lactone lactonase YvrE
VLLADAFVLPPVSAQVEQPKDAASYIAAARKAYGEKNYAAFLENAKRAYELSPPNYPRLMYYLAIGYALNGDKQNALVWLGREARMGLVLPVESDDNFTSIKDSDEFKIIVEQFHRNSLPIVSSAPAFTVREKGLVPESVAYDPVDKNFYLSSIYKRKILRVGADGTATDFANEREGLWSVAGMKVDAPRRLLWACTVAHPQMSGFRAEEDGTTALLKFDLRTGKLVKKYVLPNQPKHHWLGDLAVNSRGDVYATDSLQPLIYVVRRDRDEIETFLESSQFASPQGLDFAPGEKQMFMSDYSRGVFRIDLATKTVTPLQPAPDSTLLGIDGLYFHRGALVGVQNGVNPNRIVRLSLTPDYARVVKFETLEANNPVFDDPTLGVLVQGDLYFIANSQWGAIDEKGNLAPAEKLKDPVILKLKL